MVSWTTVASFHPTPLKISNLFSKNFFAFSASACDHSLLQRRRDKLKNFPTSIQIFDKQFCGMSIVVTLGGLGGRAGSPSKL